MDNFVYDDKSVTNAEIIWTLKNVEVNFSLKSGESLPKVFQKMFPNSVIAKKRQMFILHQLWYRTLLQIGTYQ